MKDPVKDPVQTARYVLAALVLIIGVAGLLRGYAQPGEPDGTATPARSMAVTNAGVIASEGTTAHVRLTITNNTGADDTLLGISSGAGGSTDIGPDQISIGDGETLTFGPAQIKTITINGLYGPVSPGQTVTLSLDFEQAGSVLVEAPVVTQ